MKENNTYNPQQESVSDLNRKKVAGALVVATLTELAGGGCFAANSPSDYKDNISSPTGIVSKEPESSSNKYELAFQKMGVTSIASNSPTSENAATSEAIKISFDKRIILQLNKPYYLETNKAIPGEENILKKTDTRPAVINGRTMVPVRLISETLGANVDWDGSNQTIAITKDNTVITLKLNSTLMTVKTNGQEKQVTLDVPAQVNKDSRTVVPVRAVAEAFDILVQWDSERRMVWVGYTPEEVAAFAGNSSTEVPADAIDLDATYKAFQYMVNGAKTNCLTANVFAMNDEVSGATVVLSTEDFEAADNKIDLAQKSKMTGEQLQQEYINQSAINQIRKGLTKDDFVYIKDGNCFVFNGDKVRFKNNVITIPQNYFGNKIKWSEDPQNQGVFLVNNEGEFVAKYDQEKKSWIPEVEKMSQAKAVDLACRYIDGGYLDVNNFPYKVDVGSTNVVRVYSSKEVNYTEKALFDKVEKQCKNNDVMYWWKGNVCVLNEDSQKRKSNLDHLGFPEAREYCLDANGNLSEKTIKDGERYRYYPNITFDSELGLGLTDGFRITHTVNGGDEVELKEYKLIGTTEQRKEKTLELINNFYYGKYEKIKWLPNSKGEDRICVMIGGKRGVTEKVADAWEYEIDRINKKINPDAVDKWYRQMGFGVVDCIEEKYKDGTVAMFGRMMADGNSIGVIDDNSFDKEDWPLEDLRAHVYSETSVETNGLEAEAHMTWDKSKNRWILNLKNKVIEADNPAIYKQAAGIRDVEKDNGQTDFYQFNENIIPVYNDSEVRNKWNPNGKLKFIEYHKINEIWNGLVFYMKSQMARNKK